VLHGIGSLFNMAVKVVRGRPRRIAVMLMTPQALRSWKRDTVPLQTFGF